MIKLPICIFSANDAYESLKNSYGEANCFLLKMNSRPLGFANNEHLPDPWSQFINCNIESKDYKITPETSPYASRASFDTNNDVDSKNALSYHPLSPDTDELSMVSRKITNIFSLICIVRLLLHNLYSFFEPFSFFSRVHLVKKIDILQKI